MVGSRIACLRIAIKHSITYHQSMVRVRIRLARSGDSRALADLRYRFRTETEPAAETKQRFLRRCASVSYTHLRAHETPEHLVCRLLLEKKKKKNTYEVLDVED